MGFRNPVTTVDASATAATVDTRDTTGKGVALNNYATTGNGSSSGAGAGVVWSSGQSSGSDGALSDFLTRWGGAEVGGYASRTLRMTGGTVGSFGGTVPRLDMLAATLTTPRGDPVNQSTATLTADNITLSGSVNGADPAWLSPVLQNGWTDYNYSPTVPTTYAPPRYRKLSDGSVVVGAIVKGGTIGVGVPVFTLPAGYRSSVKLPPVPALGNNAAARVDVETDGRICVVIGSAVWTSFLFVYFADS